jgi:membrane protein DedA with SNARE-associated domain
MSAVVLANVITDVTDWLTDFSSNWYFLAIIFVIAFLDSVVPVVPSETMVIIGGVAAGLGEQPLIGVIACGAVGAFLGDNTAYAIGNRLSDRITRYAARKMKRQARLDWAAEQIRTRGGLLLITARFIPGGRTVLTLSCGITKQPRRWFVAWIGVATIIWASYAALLGFFGGQTFKDNHTAAFFVAFGAAISVTIVIEVIRHLRAKRAAPEPAS